jgi:spoIIIJ-associated protein
VSFELEAQGGEPDRDVDSNGVPASAVGSERVEAEAESVGKAKWIAMKELEQQFPGLEVEHVQFELLEDRSETSEGAPVRVAAIADLSAWRSAEREFDWSEDPADRVRELLRRITAYLGLRASVDVEEREDVLHAAVSGAELGLLIGKHGQTIDAIEALCSQAAYRGKPSRRRVVVDAGGYRERREGALKRQADRGTADALRYGRPVELDSMPASERRVVHVYLKDRVEVDTHSEGDEPFRRIVITPVGRRGGQT